MKTIKLRGTQPNAPLLVFVGVIAVLSLVNALAPHQSHVDMVQPTAPLPIIIATSPPVPTPTLDGTMLQEIQQLKARVAELEAGRNSATAEIGTTPEPQPVYQMLSIQETAPSATPYTADPQMTYSESGSTVQIEVPTDAPRLCDGFGDWRDYDAKYASSPACHKATP